MWKLCFRLGKFTWMRPSSRNDDSKKFWYTACRLLYHTHAETLRMKVNVLQRNNKSLSIHVSNANFWLEYTANKTEHIFVVFMFFFSHDLTAPEHTEDGTTTSNSGKRTLRDVRECTISYKAWSTTWALWEVFTFPSIPMPQSAAWIILTSFPPSPDTKQKNTSFKKSFTLFHKEAQRL